MSNPNNFYNIDQAGAPHPWHVGCVNKKMHATKTRVEARRIGKDSIGEDTLVEFGIPGSPYEHHPSDPDVFFQGEDFVFDLYLYDFGKPIVPEDFDLYVIVKPSARAMTVTWRGDLNNGLFPAGPSRPGFYEVWIPSELTSKLPAGTYFMDIVAKSRIGGSGGARRSCTTLLHTESFAVEYAVFSQHPDSSSSNPEKLQRAGIEPTWPNKPDTVGASFNGDELLTFGTIR